MAFYDIGPHHEPPRGLCIGPDPAGSLLEMLYLEFPGGDAIIHAMPLRREFERYLVGPRR